MRIKHCTVRRTHYPSYETCSTSRTKTHHEQRQWQLIGACHHCPARRPFVPLRTVGWKTQWESRRRTTTHTTSTSPSSSCFRTPSSKPSSLRASTPLLYPPPSPPQAAPLAPPVRRSRQLRLPHPTTATIIPGSSINVTQAKL